MRRVLLMSVAVAGLLTAFAAGAPDEARGDDAKNADAKAIQGNWKPDKAELAGKPMPDAILRTISLKLENGKYDVLVGDKPDKGTYTLDATTQPGSITVTGTEGPNQGKTYPAIYELRRGELSRDDAKRDTLRICYDLSGEKRPAEFKTAAGTKLYLVTYSRKKE